MGQLLLSYFILALEIFLIHSIKNERQRRKMYFIVLFLQFFLLAGFRGLEIHNDTLSYASHFDNVSSNGHFWETEKELFNPGYLVLEKFIHNNVTSTVLGFDIVTSFIICFCSFLLFYKRARHVGIAIFLFYISGEYWTQVAVLREAFAVIVVYLCMKYLEDGRFWIAALLILLAVSFHNSAFIMFFFLLLMKFSPSKKMRIIIALSVVLVTYAIAPVMEYVLRLLSFETKYFVEGVDNGFASLNGIFNGTIGILASIGAYLMIKNANSFNYPHLYKEVLFIYFIISIVTLRLPILSRYMMYFTPFIFIMVSDLALVTPKNRKLALFVACVFAGNIIVKQFMRPEWISIFPYHFYNDSQLSLLHTFNIL